jgi:hypothetical protein
MVRSFAALNGGPALKFTHATPFVERCGFRRLDTQ